MRDIGKNIRDLRQKKNMTQEAFAEKLFVTRQTVSNYETGHSRPDIDMLIKIAQCLDTDVNTIIYGPLPSSKTQKWIKLCVSLSVAVVITILFSVLDNLALQYRRQTYTEWPWVLTTLFLKPLIPMIWGWVIMHCISCFTGLVPLRRKYASKLSWGLCALVIAYLAIVVPVVISIVADLTFPQFGINLLYTLMGSHPYMPKFLKYIPFAWILGAAVWLTGIGIHKPEA